MFALKDSSSVLPEHENWILHWSRMQNVVSQGLRTFHKEGRFAHIEMLRLINMQSESTELDHNTHRSNRLDIIARCTHTTPLII
jgi:hypothetical protein